jgi:hypothetical protein
VHVASVVAEPSLLETFLQKQGQSPEAANDLAERFFDASMTLLRANQARVQLEERFSPGKLSADALDVYNRLLDSWFGEFDTALGKELEAIRQTGVQFPAEGVARSGANDLNAEIETNQALLKELLGHNAPETRSAPAVLAEVAGSVEALRKAATQAHKAFFQPTSPALPSARDIQP